MNFSAANASNAFNAAVCSSLSALASCPVLKCWIVVLPAVASDAAASVRMDPGFINEPHALVVSGDDAQTPEIKVRTTDFADVRARRQQAADSKEPPPPVLSANALLVCPQRKCLLVHRRSQASATYGGALHLFGGAYRPPIQRGTFDSPGDRMSLEFTMVREVFEESGLIVRSRGEPVAVAHELDTGFVQYVFLGVRITAAECERLSSNSEGNVVEIPFAQLGGRLAESAGWVPSGRAHLLAWLGLGAPGAGFHPKFGKSTPKDLFDQVVGDH